MEYVKPSELNLLERKLFNMGVKCDITYEQIKDNLFDVKVVTDNTLITVDCFKQLIDLTHEIRIQVNKNNYLELEFALLFVKIKNGDN